MNTSGSNPGNVWVMPEYNDSEGKPYYGEYRKKVIPKNKNADTDKPENTKQELPTNNCFKVFISDLKGEAGNFQKISGLRKKAEYEMIREGGKSSEMYFVTHFEYSNLIMERANHVSDPLYKWIEDVESGIMVSQSMTITLYNNNKVAYSWFVKDALPISIEFQELNAEDSSIVLSKIEFAHRGISMFSE